MLPILHLNGYKIANPTVLARIPEDELVALFRATAGTPCCLGGSTSRGSTSQSSPRVSMQALDRVGTIQKDARGAAATAIGRGGR